MQNMLFRKYPVYWCNICKCTFLGTEENTEIRNVSPITGKLHFEEVLVCPKGHFDWTYRKDENYSEMEQ